MSLDLLKLYCGEDLIRQDLRPEKCGHSPTESRRIQNPEGSYSEDWNEVQQEEDELQAPDKWQRILQMVFRGGGLEINPVEDRSI